MRCAGALAERHRLERRLHHVLGPAGGEGERATSRAPARRWRRRRARRRPARSAPAAAPRGAARRGVGGVAMAQPVRQRAAHLLGLLAQLARSRASSRTSRSARRCAARSSRRQAASGARDDRQVAARQAEAELVDEPGAARSPRRRRAPRSTAASRPFGIAEAADRQARRGQAHQLEQAGDGERGDGARRQRGVARMRWPWP